MAFADTSDIRHRSYWLDQIEPLPTTDAGLPSRTDVLVVGAGYTGLSAGLVTAQAGRDTLILDAGDPGHGCSTRNGGQVSTSIKPSLAKLSARFGPAKSAGHSPDRRRCAGLVG